MLLLGFSVVVGLTSLVTVGDPVEAIVDSLLRLVGLVIDDDVVVSWTLVVGCLVVVVSRDLQS
jgi:hypothetical protein